MIRMSGSRARVGRRALLGCIFLISGLLAALDESFKAAAAASGSESYFSQGSAEASNLQSMVDSVVGDETENSGISQANNGDSTLTSDGSVRFDVGSKEDSTAPQAQEGDSLKEDSSLVVNEDSLLDGHKAAATPKVASPNFIEYGYDNIQDISADARSVYSSDGGDFSAPVAMESLEVVPKSETDSSQTSHKGLEYDASGKDPTTQEELLEPLTEKVEPTDSPHKTPKTQTPEEEVPTIAGTGQVHAGGHMESPPKSPDDFTMNDDGIKMEVRQLEQSEQFQNASGSDVIFEETSESKLPEFITKEGNNEEVQQGVESSRLTSGFSETSESGGAQSLADLESSALISQREGSGKQASLDSDISGSVEEPSRQAVADRQTRLFDLTEKSRASEAGGSGSELSVAEPTFVNPNTEDISVEPSESEAKMAEAASERADHSAQEPSRTGSISVEPPSPPSSAVEERTVGNKRVYSGPYIRTTATAGKVSPRIASVINSLVGQFEKLNLYGAGAKSGEAGSAGPNISNRFVSSMKTNFDGGAGGLPEFAPQNSQEEEFLEALKSEAPRNSFLFKNRYEEMKAMQNSSGKTLLQEEIEKLRGTYRNSLSRQFGTGKVWERPSTAQTGAPPILATYSGNEFLDKVRMINPNYRQEASQSSGPQNAANASQAQPEVQPEQPENKEDSQEEEAAQLERQGSPADSAPGVAGFGPEKPQEAEWEAEETTSEGDSNAEPFSRRLASRFEDSDAGSVDESGRGRSEDLQGSEGSSHETPLGDAQSRSEDLQGSGDSSREESPRSVRTPGDHQRPPRMSSYVATPFSYINNVKELPVGVRPQDVPTEQAPDEILDRRPQEEEEEEEEGDQGAEQGRGQAEGPREENSPQAREASISYSKNVELSPEQEREIGICYSKAKKIKTVNFGLELTESPSGAATEAFIGEFAKLKPKMKELVLFGQEALRVAEKYSKKRSWRKKTKKFKLEFLELSSDFLQHSRAVRSLLHHLAQVANPNIMEILHKIITGHSHSKQALLVQCKILYQAFYSYKNSVRSRLLKKISDLNFVDVLQEQIRVYLEQRFQPIVKAIQSNKYLRKKLSKLVPDVTLLESASADKYQELSYSGDGEKPAPGKKRGNKFTRFFRRLFRRPCLKCHKSKKQSKKQKSSNKKV